MDYIKDAYEAGKKIRDAILKNNGNLNLAVKAIQDAKINKTDLSYTYLSLCMEYKVFSDNLFIVDMLTDQTLSENVGISLCLGILSEDSEYIALSKAAEKYNLDGSTLRKAIKSGKLKEGEDCYYQEKGYLIKKSALEREYKKSKNQ